MSFGVRQPKNTGFEKAQRPTPSARESFWASMTLGLAYVKSVRNKFPFKPKERRYGNRLIVERNYKYPDLGGNRQRGGYGDTSCALASSGC